MSRFLGMLSAVLLLAGCGLLPDSDDEGYRMATDEMAPTIIRHQRVTARLGDEPHRGEIVVFRAPEGWAGGDGGMSIARVIGIGNDELACCEVAGKVVLNREPLDEPYLGTNSPIEAPAADGCRGRRFEPVKVPPGELFLMGDHRAVAKDSRCLGTVPASAVVGVVTLKSTSLRRVAVLSAVVSAAAPTDAAGFFTMFQSKNDAVWSGGDQVTSFRASNGLTYWSFGDTVLGEEDPVTGAYRPGWTMIANAILVQRGGDLAPAAPGPAVPGAAGGDRYWTQGMFEAGGWLYVLCQRVRNTADFFELRGVELARFGFRADGTLAFQGMVPTPSTGKTGGNDVSTAQYAADAVVTGGYVYVFGYANAPGDPYAPHRSYVARVPVGSVEQPSAWRFRSGGSWRAGMATATPILSAQISSVRLIGGRWTLAYKPWNGWGDTVYIERRTTPYGAPTGTVTFSSPAGTTPGGQAYQTYAPQLHPEQALSSGRLLVSIAWNGQTLGDLAADADLYKPRFIEVTLPG